MLGYDDYDAFRRRLIFVLMFHRELTLLHTVQRGSALRLFSVGSSQIKQSFISLLTLPLPVRPHPLQLTNRISDKQVKRRGSCQEDRGKQKPNRKR